MPYNIPYHYPNEKKRERIKKCQWLSLSQFNSIQFNEALLAWMFTLLPKLIQHIHITYTDRRTNIMNRVLSLSLSLWLLLKQVSLRSHPPLWLCGPLPVTKPYLIKRREARLCRCLTRILSKQATLMGFLFGLASYTLAGKDKMNMSSMV